MKPPSLPRALRRHRIASGVAAAVVALALALPLTTERSGAAVDPCRAPTGAERLTAALPHVAARIAAGEPVTVVALGSSSTAGHGASRPENSYPSRLAAELRGRLDGAEVRVINKGVGGDTAEKMAARIDSDVLAAHPDLAIWQVGTNDVLHDADPADDAAIIREGVARMKAEGIDVILMDMQYAPSVIAHAGYRDMLHAISAAGYAQGAPVFHRFQIMQAWDQTRVMPQSAALADDRLHMNDRSYGCIARLLAEGIVAASR